MKRSLLLAILAGVSLALTGSAAMISLPGGWDEDILRADLIVHARVMEIRSFWADDQRGRHIYTDAVLAPLRVVRGDPGGDRFTVTFVGGVVGDVGEFVTDAFRLGPAEEVVLFRLPEPAAPEGERLQKATVLEGMVFAGRRPMPLARFLAGVESVLAGEGSLDGDLESAEPGAPASRTTPVITTIWPDRASAGTNSTVTITGTGFGASPGVSGKVEFFYRAGKPKIPASIVSWSDTQIVCTVPIAIIEDYPASASSGPVTVTNSLLETSGGYTFTVVFGYGDLSWSGGALPVSYAINENCPDITGEGAAVQAAAAVWTGAGSNFSLAYAGPCAATGASQNGVNEVCWLTTAGYLARTTYWYNPATKIISECDLVFNDTYNWDASGSPAADECDVQSVATHEYGHFLNLRDLYGTLAGGVDDQGKALYGVYTMGSVKRVPRAEDKAGIRWVYGSPVAWGDANADTLLDTADRDLLRSYLAGSINVGQSGFTRPDNADTDADDRWNARDLVIYQSYFAAQISTLPFY